MNSNYKIKKLNFFDVLSFFKVTHILGCCGKDMSEKYGLNHWNNIWLKNFAIVCLCVLKNKIYLVYNLSGEAVATFQTKKIGSSLRFQKLATNPQFSGQGIVSVCIKAIEDMAKEEKCSKVCLEVYDKSQHAIDFYGHRGYKICGNSNTIKYNELLMKKVI